MKTKKNLRAYVLELLQECAAANPKIIDFGNSIMEMLKE